MSAMSNGGVQLCAKVTRFTMPPSGNRGDGNNYGMRLQKAPVTKKQFDEARLSGKQKSKKLSKRAKKSLKTT